MNCEQARQKLIDLAYGELPPAEAEAAEEHLRACPACRAEFDDLLAGRAAMAKMRAGEPGEVRWTPPAGKARRLSLRRWLLAGAAAAAAVLAAVTVWKLQERTAETAFAAPVEIRRLNVSLTILSEPENWPSPYWDQRGMLSGRRVLRQGWPGMALVRDQRIVRHLPKGASEVSFTDVPGAILPDSVRLRSLDDPEGLTILEQNYQYDLASAEAVLAKHIDKPVTVSFKDGSSARGALLSFDGAALVIRPDGEGPRSLARKQIKAVALGELPEGLLTRPTLLWRLENRAAANQQFEVAYLTGGLKWRADYVLKLHPAAAAPGEQAGEITDTADLVGYATVSNDSGVSFENAQLKLLAGDVNLIRPEGPLWVHQDGSSYYTYGRSERARGFREKTFFEYHLYTLGRPTSLRSAETKQIELVSGSGLKLRRGYVYDPQVNPTAARVVSELMNSQANGLGRPLPKGVVRLYAPDPAGQETYVAQTTIDHTPKDEKLRLPWGFAFDIACSATQTGGGRSGSDYSQDWQYTLRNHKDHDVTIIVIVHVPPSTYTARCGHRWHVREVGLVEIEVPVKAGAAETADFSFGYNPLSGGGLKAP